MNTIRFPLMFQGNATAIQQDNAAALTDLHLLLSTQAGEFVDDPEIGINAKRYMYNQNNHILRDILIDDIYTQIITFSPNIYLQRQNITITSDKHKVTAIIRCKNQQDFTNNTYELVLFEAEDNK